MKKDKKFLKDLESNLVGVKEKHKKAILSKYEDIITEEKAKKRKITEIINELGKPEEVAKKEIKAYKSDKLLVKVSDKVKRALKTDKKKEKDPVEEEKKKIKKELKEEKKKINKELKEAKRQEKEKNKKKNAELREEKLKEKEKKNKELKEAKKLEKEEKKNKEEKTENKEKKDRFGKLKAFVTKDIKFKKKEKTEVEEIAEVVSEPMTDIEDEIGDATEIVSEKKIFESKKDRRRRILLKTLGVILTILLLFLWLWVSVIFIATVFAYLDGIKFIGVNIALFGLDALLLWVVIMVNRAIFRKKYNLWLNLIVSIVFIIIMAVGIVIAVKQISEIKTVKDVSVKYSMTNKLSTYMLPNDIDQKFTITFNSNYNTQYVMNYDDNLKGKIKVEVKYYECYYDYYVKETSNSSYISLKLDNRDRLSVYIDDLKEGLVFDNDELSRYSVRISINPDDIGRLVIND